MRDAGDEPGPFTSLDDFCRRVDLRTVNKRVAESLIKAGAMTSLGTPGALLAAAGRRARDRRSATSVTWPPDSRRCSTSSRQRRRMPSVRFLDGGEESPAPGAAALGEGALGLYLSEHPLGDIADVSCPST